VSYIAFVAFTVYQMSVYVCVSKLLVAENVMDELDVFGFVVAIILSAASVVLWKTG
jgi:hypothetical protein